MGINKSLRIRALCPNSLRFHGSPNQPIITLIDYGIVDNYFHLEREGKPKIGAEV